MDTIQINKFSKLHNNNLIFFCKTDYILEEFKRIKNIPHNIILITGNSDYPIDESIFSLKPTNVKKWYAQNALVNDDILIPLPIGIENKLESIRPGHGVGWGERVIEKEKLLSRNLIKEPIKKYYSNFNISTNYSYRTKIKDICIKSPHIEWEESNLSLTEFFDKLLEYEAIICPIGNGIDTHRLWEVLYSNRIPITIKVGDFKIYELYKKLPIIILDNENQLYDEKLLDNKLNEIKNKQFDKDIIYFEFWVSQILNDKNKINNI
jgi:hypothetical protein